MSGGGGATAAVDCQYDIAFNMTVDEAEKQHPNTDVIGELFSDQAVYEQFRNDAKGIQTFF